MLFSYTQLMIICIAHRKDVDGIASHAIVRRYAEQENIEIEHHFVSYDDIGESLKRVESARDETVVVADIGYNRNIPIESVEKIAQNNRFLWFDHHNWEKVEILKAGVEFIHSFEKCAAELVQEYLLPEDEVAKTLAELAHYHDFRKENELAWKLYDVISSGFDKMEIVKRLASGDFWNREFEDAYEKYQKAKQKGYKFLDKHTIIKKINGYTLAIGLAPKYLSSTLACLHLQKRDVDFVIVLYPDGKMSFRRNNPEIDLVEIAELFEGGGREYAAGGRLEEEVSEENFTQVAEKVLATIKEKLYTLSGE